MSGDVSGNGLFGVGHPAWGGAAGTRYGAMSYNRALVHHLCIAMYKRYYTWSPFLFSTVAEVLGPFLAAAEYFHIVQRSEAELVQAAVWEVAKFVVF